jgi:hypothetical protein
MSYKLYIFEFKNHNLIYKADLGNCGRVIFNYFLIDYGMNLPPK